MYVCVCVLHDMRACMHVCNNVRLCVALILGQEMRKLDDEKLKHSSDQTVETPANRVCVF